MKVLYQPTLRNSQLGLLQNFHLGTFISVRFSLFFNFPILEIEMSSLIAIGFKSELSVILGNFPRNEWSQYETMEQNFLTNNIGEGMNNRLINRYKSHPLSNCNIHSFYLLGFEHQSLLFTGCLLFFRQRFRHF